MSKESDRDNRANQLNSNNDAFWQSRGESQRPDDWEARAPRGDGNPEGKRPPAKP